MKTNPFPFASRLSATAAAAGLVITFAPLTYAAPEADPAKKNDPAEVESKQYQAKQEEAEKAPAANGKVFSVEPELLSVVVEGSATPLKFKYDHNTPYVDENGKAVSMELIRPDLPLTVHYHGNGEILTASKVVVTRSMVDGASPKTEAKREQIAKENAKEVEKEKIAQATEPETVMGTVSTVEQTITINARGESTPRSFVINNSTRYLNASGQPVSTDLIFSGMPITVKAVSDGNRLIAQVITVRGGSDSAASQYPANGGVQSGGASSGTAGGALPSTGTASSGNEGTRSNGSVGTTRSSSGGGADLPFYGVYNPGIIGPVPSRGSLTADPAADTSGALASGSSNSTRTPASANSNTVQPGPGGPNRNAVNNSNNNNNPASGRPSTNPGNASNQPNPDNRPSPNQPADNQPASNQPASNQPANNQPSGTNTTAPANGSSATSGNTNTNRSGNNQNQNAGSSRNAGSGSNNAGSGSGSNSGSRSSSGSGSSSSSGSGRASGNGSSGAPAPSASGGGSGGAPAPSR